MNTKHTKQFKAICRDQAQKGMGNDANGKFVAFDPNKGSMERSLLAGYKVGEFSRRKRGHA